MSKFLPYFPECVKLARQLTRDLPTQYEKYLKITEWVSRNIHYDFIRAIKVPKKNAYPDVKGCWEKRMGICMDIAAMTTLMLKAVGVNAVMVYGHADRQYHAWVEATINGQTYRYDHSGKAAVYKKEKVYRS